MIMTIVATICITASQCNKQLEGKPFNTQGQLRNSSFIRSSINSHNSGVIDSLAEETIKIDIGVPNTTFAFISKLDNRKTNNQPVNQIFYRDLRNLEGNSAVSDITDVKPDEKNLLKLLFLVVVVVVVVSICLIASRKIEQNYLNQQRSYFSACNRKGRMHLYRNYDIKNSNGFIKEDQSHISINRETKQNEFYPSVELDKLENNTKRKLIFNDFGPIHFIDEEQKSPIQIIDNPPPTNNDNPFDELEYKGIYYEEDRPNTFYKNTNIYSNGNDMTKIKTTRASTITRTMPL